MIITLTDGTVLDPIELPKKEEHQHTFGTWAPYEPNVNKTCNNHVYYRFCTTCNILEWRIGTDADHSWNEAFTFDAEAHWQVCENCSATQNYGEHSFDGEGICTTCAKHAVTEGVEYTLSEDGTYATVTGYYGTDLTVYIADEYQGCAGDRY